VKYHMVERCRDAFPVNMMCRLLKVSTSGYDDWRDRKPNRLQQDNARLTQKIVHLHRRSDGVFGSPRVWEELRYDGDKCSHQLLLLLYLMYGCVIRGAEMSL